jgi:hypothetical protein
MGALLAAEGFDDLFGIADLADAKAEVLADFDSFAQGDDFVIHEEFERLIAAFGEFDDGAGAEPHDFAAIHFSLGKADDEGDAEAEDAVEFALMGRRKRRFWGLQQGHPFLNHYYRLRLRDGNRMEAGNRLKKRVYSFRITRLALWPPKPKLLLMAVVTRRSRAFLGV